MPNVRAPLPALLPLLFVASLAIGCRQQLAGLQNPATARDDAGVGTAPPVGPIDNLPGDGAGSDIPTDAGGGSVIDVMTAEAPCALGATRCAVGAAIVEGCDENGGWQVRETCTSVCVNGACVGMCRPGDRRCGANQIPEACTPQGEWTPESPCPVLCAGQGQCTQCTPQARRCSANSAMVEECKNDGSGYVDSQACADGCQAGKCNLCPPGAKTCSGTSLRSCRSNGSGWDEQTCKPPVGGGGEAICTGDRCDVTCAPNRIKRGDRCACPGNTVACGGLCVPATETIEVPAFSKACAMPSNDTCDPHNVPIVIADCARQVEVTLQASDGHCAPIFLQMLANGTAKGPRSAAIPPGQFSLPLNLGALGPGPITLGFQATVARAGCGVGGTLTGWGGSARISLTVR